MMEAVKQFHARVTVFFFLHSCQYGMYKVIRSYALQQSDMAFANQIFEQIESPTTFLWNPILRGFAQSDAPKDALFSKRAEEKGMKPNNRTFAFVLKACY